MFKITVAVLMATTACTSAAGADMLPLKHGIYVPADRPCKGASNAEILNYWGADASFGSSQASCKITKLARNGKVFTINDKCVDIRGGGEIVGGQNVVTIESPTRFSMTGVNYRHCGTKVQF